MLTLRVEDLTRDDREATYQRLADFIGGDDEGMRRYFESAVLPEKAVIGSWRTVLPASEHAAFDARYQELARQLEEQGVDYLDETEREPSAAQPAPWRPANEDSDSAAPPAEAMVLAEPARIMLYAAPWSSRKVTSSRKPFWTPATRSRSRPPTSTARSATCSPAGAAGRTRSCTGGCARPSKPGSGGGAGHRSIRWTRSSAEAPPATREPSAGTGAPPGRDRRRDPGSGGGSSDRGRAEPVPGRCADLGAPARSRGLPVPRWLTSARRSEATPSSAGAASTRPSTTRISGRWRPTTGASGSALSRALGAYPTEGKRPAGHRHQLGQHAPADGAARVPVHRSRAQ